MLKTIDPLLPPRLLFLLAAMGHGDVLALVDRNYPASFAGPEVAMLTGVDTTQASRAILSLLPLDTFVESPLCAMEPRNQDGPAPSSHAEVLRDSELAEGRSLTVNHLDRDTFYGLARHAKVIVQATDTRPFSCFLLTKGVIF